jgi:HTH-type transcriptional regulator/antitoxin HipB
MRVRTPTDVGLRIRERRKALHLDQVELARRVGVTRRWIIGIEKGKARADLSLVRRAGGCSTRRDDGKSHGRTRSSGRKSMDPPLQTRLTSVSKRRTVASTSSNVGGSPKNISPRIAS